MPNNTEHLGLRIPASTKHSLDKIPEDNSEFVRDILQRELDRREMMKDEEKKNAPAKIERVKELTQEIKSLEEQVGQARARFREAKKALEDLESERNKKQSLKLNIKEEIKEETDMDDVMIQGITGEIQ